LSTRAQSERIEFNRAHVTGREFAYMTEAIENAHLASSGPFSKRCTEWLVDRTGCKQAFLTHSCTAALELAFTLANIGPGDEVVMPSFTFVTTANAVVTRGGTPVFVDIRPDTLCIDETLVESALTEKTKAIVPVHYAGVGCEMDALRLVSTAHDVLLVEDAAQAVGATFNRQPLGAIGHLGALSFHETKNVSCGEGGALLVSDPRFLDRAEIVLEKGTDRRRFLRGQVDKYTWVDLGSSHALSELAAAYLWAQLEHEEQITETRRMLWDVYHSGFEDLERAGKLRRPVVPDSCEHNAHMYYLLVEDLRTRTSLIAHLAAEGIHAVFHYVPLHTSLAGRRYGRAAGPLPVTLDVSDRLVRMPLWADLGPDRAERVVSCVVRFLERQGRSRAPRRPRSAQSTGPAAS
jgi:dTDP-4-amino-4,6-dideoxygalactose transaminase